MHPETDGWNEDELLACFGDPVDEELAKIRADRANEEVLRVTAERDLKAKVDELNQMRLRLERAEVERDAARAEVDELKRHLRGAHGQCKQFCLRIEELCAQRDEARGEIKTLREAIEREHQLHQGVEADYRTTAERLRSLLAECRPVVEAVRVLQAKHDVYARDINNEKAERERETAFEAVLNVLLPALPEVK